VTGTVAKVFSPNGVDIGRRLVSGVAYPRYSKDYIDAEDEARKAKRGMWRGTFVKLGVAGIITATGIHALGSGRDATAPDRIVIVQTFARPRSGAGAVRRPVPRKPDIPVTKREDLAALDARNNQTGPTRSSPLPREQPIGVSKGSNDGR
jgi:hypothetical protein